MQFFLPMNPPTATAQETQSTLRGGKHVYYKNARLLAAEDQLTYSLKPYAPPAPMTGPVSLSVIWLYPAGRNRAHGHWKDTRPDTDNLDKMLKDVMTRLRFWQDDAQVCDERIRKLWSHQPGLFIQIEALQPQSGLQWEDA